MFVPKLLIVVVRAQHSFISWAAKFPSVCNIATLASFFFDWLFKSLISLETYLWWSNVWSSGWEYRSLGLKVADSCLLGTGRSLLDLSDELINKLLADRYFRMTLLLSQMDRDVSHLLSLLSSHDHRAVTICVRYDLLFDLINIDEIVFLFGFFSLLSRRRVRLLDSSILAWQSSLLVTAAMLFHELFEDCALGWC